jgi:thiol-disulfide isomerase/thioredoxin
MADRRAFLAAAAATLFAPAAFAQAPGARVVPYSDAAFAAAQAAGRPILVAVEASWCPTCRAQKPILGALLARPAFADMVALSVDFDSQKDAVRKLDARMQSTLVVFRGTAERGRSVGDTNAASIEALLAKAA